MWLEAYAHVLHRFNRVLVKVLQAELLDWPMYNLLVLVVEIKDALVFCKSHKTIETRTQPC